MTDDTPQPRQPEDQPNEDAATLSTPDSSPSPGSDPVPDVAGYTVVRKLGEGGMGVVYEAHQLHPPRRVALKVVRGGSFADPLRVRMFRRETEALARLKHPNIGAIYEAGQTKDGRPFFAMELVTGATLTEYLAGMHYDRAELRQKLDLFKTICQAVHYAHQRGVIHRDLKPSNIIVTPDAVNASAAPSVKILDFGLARIADPDTGQPTLVTEIGVIKGTLAYMSPEQTLGASEVVDIRADVYALGVILYEMIAGRRPHSIERDSLVEALRKIQQEPPPPIRIPDGGRVDADVETIVFKALEKDPDRRYASAAGLGGDVDRYLASQPILARPPSAMYLIRKFTQRNRALVLGLALASATLVLAAAVSMTFGVREARQRRAAEWATYVANITAAEAGLRLFETAEVKRRLAAGPPQLRGWEWRHLVDRSDFSERAIAGPTSRIYPVAASPDGRFHAAGSVDPENRIWLWDAASGRLLWDVEGGTKTSVTPSGRARTGGIRGLAFSPDSSRLVSGADDGTVRIWDVATGAMLRTLSGHTSRVNAVAFAANGKEIVSASFDGTVRRWDAHSGAERGVVARHENGATSVAVCPDGRVLSGGFDRLASLWDPERGAPIFAFRADDSVLGVACSAAGNRVAVAGVDGRVHLLNAATGVPIGEPGRHEDVVNGIAFDAKGRWLATASKDRTVRLWDAETLEPVATWVGHDNVVISVDFDVNGGRLISGSWDRTLRVWRLSRENLSPILVSEPGPFVGLSVLPDGRRIVLGSRDGGIVVRDARSGAELARVRGIDAKLTSLQVAADGTRVAGAYTDGHTRVWELGADDSLRLLRDERLDGIALGPFVPGTTEVFLAPLETVTFFRWDYRTGERHPAVDVELARLWDITPSPDGKTVVVSGSPDPRSGRIQLRDRATGRLIAEREFGHVDPAAKIGNPVVSVAFSPDGSYFATTHGQDFTVRLWDAASLRPMATLAGHTEIVRGIAFSPDGTRLASSSDDYTIRIWTAPSGVPLLALRTEGHRRVLAVHFTPDGESIISREVANWGQGPSEIRVWRSGGPAPTHRSEPGHP